jgi:NAD+ kinase
MMNTTSLRRVGILTNINKPNADAVRNDLAAWLAKRDITVCDSRDQAVEKLFDSELIICLGGDGTMLHLAGKMVDREIPVLGVNLGGLGFLTEVRLDELYEELKVILSGQFTVENRMMLNARASSSSEKNPSPTERRFQALNDIVINREGLTRYMEVKVEVGREYVTRFFGDGVIVATPTGSTAYSLSAGGPLVHPSLDNVIITPICPHTSSLRPLVVSGDQSIRLQIKCDHSQEKALLTADGQSDFQIDESSQVEITRSVNRFKLVKSSKRSYFSTLREKFKIPT